MHWLLTTMPIEIIISHSEMSMKMCKEIPKNHSSRRQTTWSVPHHHFVFIGNEFKVGWLTPLYAALHTSRRPGSSYKPQDHFHQKLVLADHITLCPKHIKTWEKWKGNLPPKNEISYLRGKRLYFTYSINTHLT